MCVRTDSTQIEHIGFTLQDKMDGFVPAHFLGWYIKVSTLWFMSSLDRIFSCFIMKVMKWLSMWLFAVVGSVVLQLPVGKGNTHLGSLHPPVRMSHQKTN